MKHGARIGMGMFASLGIAAVLLGMLSLGEFALLVARR